MACLLFALECILAVCGVLAATVVVCLELFCCHFMLLLLKIQ